MIKKCSNCGNEFPDDAIFCSKCGKKIDDIIEDDSKKESSVISTSTNIDIQKEAAGQTSSNATNESKNVLKPPKKKDKTVIYALLVICAVSLGIRGYTAYLNNKNKASLEKYVQKKQMEKNRELFEKHDQKEYGYEIDISSSYDTLNKDTVSYNTIISLFEESTEKTTPDSYENKEERWDADNCIYSNFKIGISFSLPKYIAWHKVSGTAKHTAVKFVQPDTQLTMFININPIEGTSKVTDIWDIYEEYTNTIAQLVKSTVNSNSAEQIEGYNFKKAKFCGKHAIKNRYTSFLDDDRYDDKIRMTTISYTFLYNNSMATVTVKCYDEIIDFFKSQDITMEDFLKSFHLIPISK